ncbi:sugar transferase [Actinoplanes rectilineatus]|uniref:sugar transferase n=1 Tax=Actinoplanes rectilineatus TaxID=113571 RepID=UPI0009F824CF|nr:sugar transferase [Actinoplanes rectilineatus]
MDLVRNLWNLANRLAAAVMLTLLAPVVLAVAVWIRIADGRGVLFVQDRAGKDGVPFRMLKFRSMVHDSVALSAQLGIDDPFGLVENDPRITACGRFLRRTSLDELPQLINVVRGDMNLVGPRPDVLPQVANYSAQDARRLEVKPGITGWAQVNGRDDIDWPARFKLDRWYVDNWSPALDLRILWRTALTVQRGEPPVHVDTLNIERSGAPELERSGAPGEDTVVIVRAEAADYDRAA